MAARKNAKALKVAAHKINVSPYLKKREDMGDTVHYYGPGKNLPDDLDTYDVILGPKAWRSTEGMEKLVEVAFAAARSAKYKPKKKDEEEDEE